MNAFQLTRSRAAFLASEGAVRSVSHARTLVREYAGVEGLRAILARAESFLGSFESRWFDDGPSLRTVADRCASIAADSSVAEDVAERLGLWVRLARERYPRADHAMEYAVNRTGARAVEALYGRSFHWYWQGTQFLYANTGNPRDRTVFHDAMDERFLVSSVERVFVRFGKSRGLVALT